MADDVATKFAFNFGDFKQWLFNGLKGAFWFAVYRLVWHFLEVLMT